MAGSETYNVKGSSIATKLQWVRDHYGDEGVDQLRLRVDDSRLDSILSSSWYPFELFDQVNVAVAK